MKVWLAYVFYENVDQSDRKWKMLVLQNGEVLLLLLFNNHEGS